MALCFLVVGILFVLGPVAQLVRVVKSHGWATAPGTVTQSAVEEYEESDSDGHWTAYRHVFTYTYAVAGRVYHGKVLRLARATPEYRRGCEALVKRYPVGSTHTVYYRPDKPHDACLDRGVGVGSLLFYFLLMGLGVALTCASLALLTPKVSN